MSSPRSSALASVRIASEAWLLLREAARDPEAVAAEHALMHESGLAIGPLNAVRALPGEDAMPMRRLAEVLGCDASYVSLIADALEAGGWAHRRTDPADRRRKSLELTAKGREFRTRALEEWAAPPSSFGALNESDLRRLRELLSRLVPNPRE